VLAPEQLTQLGVLELLLDLAEVPSGLRSRLRVVGLLG
jgi:hypothetical protein